MNRWTASVLVVLAILGGSCRDAVAGESRPGSDQDSSGADSTQEARPPAPERGDKNFLANAGKHIRKILIKDLEVFGPSMDDTTEADQSWAAGLLSHVNSRTREGTIRESLLFEEGDAIDPFRLAESERILRNLPYVSDATIAVQPIRGNRDSVDVRVVVKETWTLQLSAKLGESERMKVSLAEKNFLGRGHQIAVSGTRVNDATPPLGFSTDYSIQNISGTFITGRVEYEKMLREEIAGLALTRELLSPVFEYAGGLALRRISVDEEDSLLTRADNASNLIDLWAGRQFHLGAPQKRVLRRRIMFVSARVRHVDFTRRPDVTPSTFTQYHDLSHYLGSLAFIRIRYFRTELFYDFSRAEDVPHGYLARVTYGMADTEFQRRPYGSASLALGGKLGGLGYGAAGVRVGGYPDHGALEQGVLRARALYHTKLQTAGKWRFRQFIRSDYTTGINRFADESIDLDGDESIRGARYDGSVVADKRLRLNLEHIVFTPWKPWGVTSAWFGFADLDVHGSKGENLLAQQYYSGLGLGVRLHKAAFGIGPLELRFAYYPRLPLDHNSYVFSASGEQRFPVIDFLPGSPEIVEY